MFAGKQFIIIIYYLSLFIIFFRVIRLETCNYSTYLTANGRHANGFHNLPDESQYSTDLKTTLSSSPPTETITYKMMKWGYYNMIRLYVLLT